MSDTAHDSAEAYEGVDQPDPTPQLRALDRLVGEWTVDGGAPGTVRYEWMPGGYFLIQHVDLEQFGQKVTGFEDVVSRFYDSLGNTLDYVYELEGDTLTIWGGAKGSPAYFRGTFSADDRVMDGEWVYPGGGGYPSTMTRV